MPRTCRPTLIVGLTLACANVYACSYDGMPLDLSLAHPSSLTVALAAQQAYQETVIAKPVTLPGGFGMRRAMGLLDKLRQRLPASTPAFSLLLVEPGLWSRFSADGVTLHTTPQAGERLIISSEGALLALEKSQLSIPQALTRHLLVIDGADAQRLQALLLDAYPQ